MTTPADEVLTTAEVAHLLQVTRQRIPQLEQSGVLTPARVTGQGLHLFLRSDVEALARRRAQERADAAAAELAATEARIAASVAA